MNPIFAKVLAPAGLLGILLSPVAANAATTYRTVNNHWRHQQARIEQGERSGRLTDREARRLERRESRIRRQEASYHRRGRLTAAERRRLRREERRTSRAIYRQKHDAQVR